MDLENSSKFYNSLGQDESNFLPLGIRQVIKALPQALGMEDYFYMRLFPLNERLALYNNFLANQWATGFVPMMHYSNLNSKTCPVISNKLVSKIIGNLRIEGEKETDMSIIADSIVNWNESVMQFTTDTLDRGEACVTTEVIEINNEKKIKLTIYPLNRYQLSKSATDEIYDAILFKQLFQDENGGMYSNYLLCEHRFYRKRNDIKVAYVEYYVTKNVWQDRLGFWKEDVKHTRLEIQDIPKEIVNVLQGLELNKPKEIPSLGVYRFKNSAINRLARYTDIGESQFINATDWMMTVDTSMTYKEMDKYIGRGRVLLPRRNSSGNGLPNKNKGRRDNTLDFSFVTPYVDESSASLDSKTPLSAVQFDTRAEQWKLSFEEAQAQVCIRCGLSVIDFDPSLATTVRTATEIDYMKDVTATTVKEKRQLLKDELNRMVRDIAKLLDIEAAVFVVFDPSAIVDKIQAQSMVSVQYNNGLMSLQTAIKTLHPEWKQVEVDAEIERINNERDSRVAAGAFDQTFGV